MSSSRVLLGKIGVALTAIPVVVQSFPPSSRIAESVPLRLLPTSTLAASAYVVLLSLLAGAATWWLERVGRAVPTPYLDEVFHVPQAQQYCAGAWDVWDDKITTPPGLYIVSLVAAWGKLLQADFSTEILRDESDTTKVQEGDMGACSTQALRSVNVWGIVGVALVAILCRRQLLLMQSSSTSAKSSEILGSSSGIPRKSCIIRPYVGSLIEIDSIHTGLNVALFPVLFFFSGLYYTDIISTLSVLVAYLHHLYQSKKSRNGPSFGHGLLAVLLGTVTLWMRQTNVFWVVVYFGGLEAVRAVSSIRQGLHEGQRGMGPSSNVSLSAILQASISSAIVYDPPVIGLETLDIFYTLASLVTVVVLNLRQSVPRLLRFVWPQLFILLGFVLFVLWNGGVVLGDKANHVATIHLAQLLYLGPLLLAFSFPLSLSHLWRLFTRTSLHTRETLSWLHLAWLALYIVGMGVIVHYNTLIHPFTLADNRHYMFYIFRYTIRRVRVRYALVPVYVVCRWLVWAVLGPSSRQGRSTMQVAVEEEQPKDTAWAIDSLATVSSAIILGLSTSLSLVTAPLVEPRYFILPWVFWRLLVPSDVISNKDLSKSKSVVKEVMAHQWPVFLESVWFVVVNVVTMYLFLHRPFYWYHEGNLADEGRIQRFLW